MKKLLILLPALVMLLAACGKKTDYTVTLTVPEQLQGTAMMLLTDDETVVDSVAVTDTIVTFAGKVEAPQLVTLVSNQFGPIGAFVLEPGVITFDAETMLFTGTPENDAYATYLTAARGELSEAMEAGGQEAVEQTLKDKVVPQSIEFIRSNPSSHYVKGVIQSINYYVTDEQVQELHNILPADSEAGKYLDEMEAKRKALESTQPGNAYTDFTVNGDGTEQTLSQYIEPGKWTLVDFWASWCGPCRREIPVIKQLYDKYHAKGLNVVGVDVWEPADNGKAVLDELGIVWPVLYAGEGQEATDLYGIKGIPCILLINPEGRIVARDLFDDELVSAVTEAMEPAK